MTGHDGRERKPHDWQMTAKCDRCGGAVYETRRPGAYGRQDECKPWCRRPAPKKGA